METVEILDVRALAPAQKHLTVFKTFGSLQEGAAFILQNDHAPIPLFLKVNAERGEAFVWEKLENGPEIWKVKITKAKVEREKITPLIENTTGEKEDSLYECHVTLLEPELKHPTIFKHFDSLKRGAGFCILNDHDPKPLYVIIFIMQGND